MISLKNTKDLACDGVKFLVYSRAGAGKTTLIKTLPDPIIISAESGLLSLQGTNYPLFEVKNIEDLREAYAYCSTCTNKSIALDSVSEIAEVILSHEKKIAKDPRQAYGAMQETITELIRAFRDIKGKHVYFSAKQEKTQDDTGKLLFAPSMPGNKVGQSLPYFFDEVFCLRTKKGDDGETVRMLQTFNDEIYEGKDRSGKLDPFESCDLGKIINKITGEATK